MAKPNFFNVLNNQLDLLLGCPSVWLTALTDQRKNIVPLLHAGWTIFRALAIFLYFIKEFPLILFGK